MKNVFFLFLLGAVALGGCSNKIEKKLSKLMIENPSTQAEKQTNMILQYGIDKGLDLTSTESGIHYVITQEGSGDFPNKKSQVKAHYAGTLLDGTPFDSSYDRGEPLSFGLNQVIVGWQEAIQLLQKGSKGTFIIPSDLAYGSRNMGVIQPNSVLVFDIELVDFK